MQVKRNVSGVLLSFVAMLWLSVPTAFAASLVDKSFNPGTGANGFVETVLEQPDGKILICGNFTQFNGVPMGYIGRLNPDGSIDTSFSGHPSYWVRTMALQPDGKIVIGGWFSNVEGQPRNTIARLNSDGSLDPSFRPGTGAWGTLGTGIDGKTNEFIFATAVTPDGKILITGNFTNYNGTGIRGLARLNSDGSLDRTYNGGDDLNTWGRSLTLLDGGRFIVTGWFNHFNHGDHSRMAIVNADGSADNSFAPDFGLLSAVYSAIPLPGGKYLASGHSETNTFHTDIARLNSDGSFDTSFVGSANDKTEMVRLQSDGKILLCGYFTSVDNQPRTSIARMNPDGTLDTSFNVNVDNFAWSMAVDHNNRILLVGGFHTVDGYSRNGVVRLFETEQPEDATPPTLVQKTPSEKTSTIASATLTISGTAEDANGVANVSATVNGDGIAVDGTTDWTATAPLLPGTNTVIVSASDTFGNTASLTRYYYHPGKTPLVITTDGNGTVAPNLNNAMLVAGQRYSVTAVPKRGYIFGSWSGSVESTSPTITFVMDRGTTLNATFVPNPFTPSVGMYRGLVTDESSPTAATAGTIQIVLADTGKFSARLSIGGAAYGVAGRFDANLTASSSLARHGKSPLTVNLKIADAQTIQGTVSDGSFTSTLTAYRAAYDARHPATALTSTYTIALPGDSGAGAPSGYGYLSATVAASGAVAISGALADAAPAAEVTSLAANGKVPFYWAYNGGVIFGWLTFTPNGGADSDVQGTLHWEKKTRTNTLFSVDTSVVGSVYHAPSRGAQILTLSNPTLQVDDGTLSETLSDTFTIDSRNRVTFSAPNDNRFRLGFVLANGRFSGTFVDPATRRAATFQGVVLQKYNVGAGFNYIGRQTGRVYFGETGTSSF